MLAILKCAHALLVALSNKDTNCALKHIHFGLKVFRKSIGSAVRHRIICVCLSRAICAIILASKNLARLSESLSKPSTFT